MVPDVVRRCMPVQLRYGLVRNWPVNYESWLTWQSRQSAGRAVPETVANRFKAVH